MLASIKPVCNSIRRRLETQPEQSRVVLPVEWEDHYRVPRVNCQLSEIRKERSIYADIPWRRYPFARREKRGNRRGILKELGIYNTYSQTTGWGKWNKEGPVDEIASVVVFSIEIEPRDLLYRPVYNFRAYLFRPWNLNNSKYWKKKNEKICPNSTLGDGRDPRRMSRNKEEARWSSLSKFGI